MRLISACGTLEINYEKFSYFISKEADDFYSISTVEKPCLVIGSGYNSFENAYKAMDMIRKDFISKKQYSRCLRNEELDG